MFENMVAALKLQKRKIVFTEGTDPRILEAAFPILTNMVPK